MIFFLADLGLSNLSITEGAKTASAAAAPQTRAPAVTRRSTFHTSGKDDEEEQGSGVLDVDRPSEISAQEKYVVNFNVILVCSTLLVMPHISFVSFTHLFHLEGVIYVLIPSIMMHNA